MFMPFVRLVAIYAVVIIAITAFFQRDKVMELIGFGDEPEVTAPEEPKDDDAGAQAVEMTDGDMQENQQPTTEATPPQSDRLVIVQPTPDEPAAPAQVQSAPGMDRPQDQLAEARQAYWTGDQAKAEQIYRALAEETPDNPDIHGELGNILYGQGRYQEAADSYLAAGKLLAGRGNSDQVQQIIGVLRSIAPQKAAALRSFAAN